MKITLTFSEIRTDLLNTLAETEGFPNCHPTAYNEPYTMPRFRQKGVLERNAIVDLWNHSLSKIPTVYGRLVYLSSLCDPNSGTYRHHGMYMAYGREETMAALRKSHEKTFAEWLRLPLASQDQDLKDYLSSNEEPIAKVVDYWLRSKVYRNQIPASARKMERELFDHNLETLLTLLRNARPKNAAGAPLPGSSPRE